MIFFFKRKKLHIDAITANPVAFKVARPTKTADWYPQWFKTLPREFQSEGGLFPTSTIKRCSGVLDLFQRGLVMPLWSDLAIELGPIGTPHYRYKFSDEASALAAHDATQRGQFLPESHYQHFKLFSPWQFECVEDVDFLASFPMWNQARPDLIFAPTAVTNFALQTSTNVDVFLARGQEQRNFVIEAGHPVMQYIPISDRELVVKHHLVDQLELQKRTFNPLFKFTKIRQNTRRMATSGCPLSGGIAEQQKKAMQ